MNVPVTQRRVVLSGTVERLMEASDFAADSVDGPHKVISIRWTATVTSETIIMIATLFQNPKATSIKRTAKFSMSVVVIAKQTRLMRNTPPLIRRLKSIGSPPVQAAKPSRAVSAAAAPGMGPIAPPPWVGSKPSRSCRLVVWAQTPAQVRLPHQRPSVAWT